MIEINIRMVEIMFYMIQVSFRMLETNLCTPQIKYLSIKINNAAVLKGVVDILAQESRERRHPACKRRRKAASNVSRPFNIESNEKFERFFKRFAGRMPAFPTDAGRRPRVPDSEDLRSRLIRSRR
jgi:hypothetical protein